MLKEILYYEDYNGDVSLLKEDKSFSVIMKRFISAGTFRCKIFSSKDYDIALDKYNDYIEALNGRKPVRICVYNPNRRRSCNAKNCPKKLGGEDYWRLFREACLFRTR